MRTEGCKLISKLLSRVTLVKESGCSLTLAVFVSADKDNSISVFSQLANQPTYYKKMKKERKKERKKASKQRRKEGRKERKKE